VTVAGRTFLAPPLGDPLQPGPQPTFSVAIAAYQAADTIAEAVESALAQTLLPHEIVVCDDGSTDDLDTALAPYRNEIVLLRKENGGAASAKNAAARAATGEFLAILDADDAYFPERLEALAELGVARPDLDILCTDAVLEVDGETVERFGEGCAFAVEDQDIAILERCFCIASAYRRTTLLAIGGFDESLRTGEDWDCLVRLMLDADASAGLVDEPLYRYRIHRSSVTADRIETLRDRLTLLERVGQRAGLSVGQHAALARSLARQRAALILTEAEAALRSRSQDARTQALAVAREPRVPLRSRAAALAAALAPRAAAKALERRDARGGRSRVDRTLGRSPRGRT
jgi:Glycosyl transferase family 2